MPKAGIYFATLCVIVVYDLLVGVMTGIVLSALKLLLQFSQLEIDLTIDRAGSTAKLRLEGAATFLKLPVLAQKLGEVPLRSVLHVEIERLRYIDHACLALLMNWAKQQERQGGSLIVDWQQLQGRFSTEAVRQPIEREPKLAMSVDQRTPGYQIKIA